MFFKIGGIIAGLAVLTYTCDLRVHAQSNSFPGVGTKAAWMKANGFFDEGNYLLQSKRKDDAIAKYRQAIAVYANDYHYHFNLALALKHKGDLSGAVDAFRQASQLNSGDWKVWKGLANTLYQQHNYAEAKTAFQQALGSNPPPKEVSQIKQGMTACGAFMNHKPAVTTSQPAVASPNHARADAASPDAPATPASNN